MSGEIPVDGVIDVLREIESKRITGRIRFTAGTEAGEVELVGGQIALDQDPLPDGSDPVEALLSLRSGLYAVHQRLPVLPVSHGDDHRRAGSLAVHVPADLMNYCEQAGLTGTLTLKNAGQLVEAVYEAGELLALRIDGREDAELAHVFAWDEGSFEIRTGKDEDVRSLVPTLDDDPAVPEEDSTAREPTTQFVRPKRRDESGRQFLKVLEIALTDIVDKREKARPPTRTGPQQTARRSTRPRPPSVPAPRMPRKDATVRVVYLSGDPAEMRPSSTRHSAAKRAVEDALPDAHPTRRSEEMDRVSSEPPALESDEAPPMEPLTASAEAAALKPPRAPRDMHSSMPAMASRSTPSERAEGGASPVMVWIAVAVVIALLVLAVVASPNGPP